MRKKIFWLVFIIAVAALMFYMYREYNRRPADLSGTKPAYNLSAKALANEFENDETAATAKYAGKIIEVSGVIDAAEYRQDSLINILMGDGLHKVSCQLDDNHKMNDKHYRQQDAVTVRGMCTGFLLNVELNRCVIVK